MDDIWPIIFDNVHIAEFKNLSSANKYIRSALIKYFDTRCYNYNLYDANTIVYNIIPLMKNIHTYDNIVNAMFVSFENSPNLFKHLFRINMSKQKLPNLENAYT